MVRLFWLTLGFLALGLALLGVALPLLPAIPFVLVSAYAFARSSPRFHDWLVGHPHLGPQIRDWQRERAINRNAKVTGLSAMAAAFALSWFAGLNTTVLAIQAVVLGTAAIFVATRPTPTSES